MVELSATIIGVFPIRAQFGLIASIVNSSSEMSSSSRIALFIDGANLYATAKALGFEIDYNRLLVGFRDPWDAGARLLLHRNYRGSGTFVDPSPRRLAGLQRLHRGDQGD